MKVEILRRKMEGLSNGMLLERMKEEYGSMLSTANSSAASSASTSQRIEFTDSSSSSTRQSYKVLAFSWITMSYNSEFITTQCLNFDHSLNWLFKIFYVPCL